MAVTVQMRADIARLYVGLFGRAPDGEGLGFWAGRLDQGASLAQVAEAMYATAPARNYYPQGLQPAEIVQSFYRNVLGRAPDAEGLAFWTDKLQAGTTAGAVIAELVSVVATYTGTDPMGQASAALFNNRAEVALYYGERGGTIEAAAVPVTATTGDADSVTAAKAVLDRLALEEELVLLDVRLTPGVDNVVATRAPSTIGGDGVEVSAQDRIVGSLATSDRLYVGDSSAVPLLQGIEWLQYTDPATGLLDLRSTPDVATLTVRNQVDVAIALSDQPELRLSPVEGSGNRVQNNAAADLDIVLRTETGGDHAWTFNAGAVLVIDHTAGTAARSGVLVRWDAAASFMLHTGGTSLADATGRIDLASRPLEAGAFVADGTNIAASTQGATTHVDFDLNGSGAYEASADFRISFTGQAAVSCVYDPALGGLVFS